MTQMPRKEELKILPRDNNFRMHEIPHQIEVLVDLRLVLIMSLCNFQNTMWAFVLSTWSLLEYPCLGCYVRQETSLLVVKSIENWLVILGGRCNSLIRMHVALNCHRQNAQVLSLLLDKGLYRLLLLVAKEYRALSQVKTWRYHCICDQLKSCHRQRR